MNSRFLKLFAIFLFALMVLVPAAGADSTEEAIEKAAEMNGAVVRMHKEGRTEEAVEVGERAYKIIVETLGSNHPSTATALYNLATLYEEMGEFERAETLFKRALKIREDTLGARHRDTISTRKVLAAVQRAMADRAGRPAAKNGGGLIGARVPMANGGGAAGADGGIERKTSSDVKGDGASEVTSVKTAEEPGKIKPITRKTVKAKPGKKMAPKPVARTLSTVPKSGRSGGLTGATGAMDEVAVEMEAAGAEEEAPVMEMRSFPMVLADGETPPVPAEAKFDEYKVKLGVDAVMKIPGPAGLLRVWIGAPEYTPEFREGMREAVGTLPVVGQTAKVKAVAPDFEVEPGDSICIKLHATGVDALFELRPKKKGEFKVSAVVKLYETADCSGAAIPKAVETLYVMVEVDAGKMIGEGAEEMGGVFWEKFLDFWGAAVALFFGLILFLLRGKLKKIFGFGGDKS